MTALHVECSPSSQLVTGRVLYADPSARVFLSDTELSSGLVYGIIPRTCDNDTSEGHYAGVYDLRRGLPSLPPNTGQFTYDIYADSVCNSGFGVAISFTGGRYDGYANKGCVTGKIRPLTVK